MPEPEKPREWTNCPWCNRILWVGDPCDCPKSQEKPKPKPEGE